MKGMYFIRDFWRGSLPCQNAVLAQARAPRESTLPPLTKRTKLIIGCALVVALGFPAIVLLTYSGGDSDSTKEHSIESVYHDEYRAGANSYTSTVPSRPLEPIEGQNPEAEKTIREIEAERPAYLKGEDRTLIRAMIINDAKNDADKDRP